MLTPEEVRHVAMLARLGLSDEEVESLRAQLSQVLEHIAMLDRLDTAAIPPTAQILASGNVTRDDEPRPSLGGDALLANAPQAEESLLRVPAVFDEFRTEGGPAGEPGAGGGS